ncbi:MAG: zinc-ribbon and DUF3426 domain-containing protein [Methylovulum miyakonense]|uniref:zinc-ribbon and DUF3426 domain-containing protein n=1 Tax=Methylovulum miyakonense TaxID=645578 RepID=UPI003BB64833
MFTLCPNCSQQQELTAEQLRVTRAILYCPRCGIHFDALEQLSDTRHDARLASSGEGLSGSTPIPPFAPVQEPSNRHGHKAGAFSGRYRLSGPDSPAMLPWEQARQVANPHWRSGVLAGLLLLAGQLLYFHGNGISQNHLLRRFCQPLKCPLPAYQNAAELAIVGNALEPLPDHGHLFRVLVINQAAFAQTYPEIDLTLQDYEGNAIAHRRFRLKDYLLNPEAASIQPDAMVELRLHIAPATQNVGGYTFDLAY